MNFGTDIPGWQTIYPNDFELCFVLFFSIDEQTLAYKLHQDGEH